MECIVLFPFYRYDSKLLKAKKNYNAPISGVTEQLGAVGQSLALTTLTPQQSDCGCMLARMGCHCFPV